MTHDQLQQAFRAFMRDHVRVTVDASGWLDNEYIDVKLVMMDDDGGVEEVSEARFTACYSEHSERVEFTAC